MRRDAEAGLVEKENEGGDLKAQPRVTIHQELGG
jgi:hypothetical protein